MSEERQPFHSLRNTHRENVKIETEKRNKLRQYIEVDSITHVKHLTYAEADSQ